MGDALPCGRFGTILELSPSELPQNPTAFPALDSHVLIMVAISSVNGDVISGGLPADICPDGMPPFHLSVLLPPPVSVLDDHALDADLIVMNSKVYWGTVCHCAQSSGCPCGVGKTVEWRGTVPRRHDACRPCGVGETVE